MWSLHVLPLCAWGFSGYSSFSPQYKDKHTRSGRLLTAFWSLGYYIYIAFHSPTLQTAAERVVSSLVLFLTAKPSASISPELEFFNKTNCSIPRTTGCLSAEKLHCSPHKMSDFKNQHKPQVCIYHRGYNSFLRHR